MTNREVQQLMADRDFKASVRGDPGNWTLNSRGYKTVGRRQLF